MKPPTTAELRRSAEASLQAKAKPAAGLSMEDAQKMLHELQVHEIELEMQNQALREAKSTEELALHRYTELFDFAPIAYFVLDPSSKISQVNLRGANLLELERSTLIGKHFLGYLSQEHRVTLSDCLAQAFETGNRQNCEILVRVGKQALWLSLEANVGIIGSDCLVAMADITEIKVAESIRFDKKKKQRAALIQEVHHRIKNHLQGLSGLLRLRKNASGNTKDAFDEAITQVESIATVYGLQANNTRASVDLAQIQDAIVRSIIGLSGIPLVFNKTIEEDGSGRFDIKADHAVTVALVINEMIMNAVKHFKPVRENSQISIDNFIDDGAYTITVTNPGRLPKDFDLEKGTCLGTGLDLLKVMIPPDSSTFSISQQGVNVLTKLELRPNIFRLDENS